MRPEEEPPVASSLLISQSQDYSAAQNPLGLAQAFEQRGAQQDRRVPAPEPRRYGATRRGCGGGRLGPARRAGACCGWFAPGCAPSPHGGAGAHSGRAVLDRPRRARCATSLSARLKASCTPLFIPMAPIGLFTWAASPARIARPERNCRPPAGARHKDCCRRCRSRVRSAGSAAVRACSASGRVTLARRLPRVGRKMHAPAVGRAFPVEQVRPLHRVGNVVAVRIAVPAEIVGDLDVKVRSA